MIVREGERFTLVSRGGGRNARRHGVPEFETCPKMNCAAKMSVVPPITTHSRKAYNAPPSSFNTPPNC